MEKSEGGEVELAIAVNWWTNMSYTGAAYASSQFLRRCTKLLVGEMEEEEVE